jgi:hypothetical protein
MAVRARSRWRPSGCCCACRRVCRSAPWGCRAIDRPPRAAFVHCARRARPAGRGREVDGGRADRDRRGLAGRTRGLCGVEIEREGVLGKAAAIGAGPPFGANGDAGGLQRCDGRTPQIAVVDEELVQRSPRGDGGGEARQRGPLWLIGGQTTASTITSASTSVMACRLKPVNGRVLVLRPWRMAGSPMEGRRWWGPARDPVRGLPQRRQRGLDRRRVTHRHVCRDPPLQPIDLGEHPRQGVGCAAGSCQSISSAALRLDAASSGRSAACSTCPRDTPSLRAAHVTTVRMARPIKFHVSSTRPAPRSGDESNAARSRCQPNPPRCWANATVRSSRRSSRSWAIRRSRNATNTPCEKGAFVAPRHPRTNCHRRSMRAVTTASASPN